MTPGRPTTSAASPARARRSAAFAGVLALLAMLGVASGLWPVAHQNIAHAAAAQAHDHHDSAPAPHSDSPPRPLDPDCPVCDLIAGSQPFPLVQPAATLDFAQPAGSVAADVPLHLYRTIDLTAWSARPPPRVG